MNTEIVIAIISGLVIIISSLINKTDIFSRKHHDTLKDIDLYNALPNNSAGKSELITHIDRKVSEYIKKSTEHRRSPIEIVSGLIFLSPGLYLSWFFYTSGGWWLIGLPLSILISLIGIYGTISGFQKTERDSKGNRVSNK